MTETKGGGVAQGGVHLARGAPPPVGCVFLSGRDLWSRASRPALRRDIPHTSRVVLQLPNCGHSSEAHFC
jgi:hypothetical protein